MSTINDLFNNFEQRYNEINSRLASSTLFYQNNIQVDDIVYSKDIHHTIAESSFIDIFLLWEDFLEKSFILYMCGQADLKGNCYNCYSTPKDDEHAYSMIKGTKSYPDWTNIEDVKKLSSIYFENYGPYCLLSSIPIEFSDIKVIRNRISHISKNSVESFKRLLAKTVSRSTGISVSEFLLMIKDNSTTYYTYYTNFIFDNVKAICNK